MNRKRLLGLVCVLIYSYTAGYMTHVFAMHGGVASETMQHSHTGMHSHDQMQEDHTSDHSDTAMQQCLEQSEGVFLEVKDIEYTQIYYTGLPLIELYDEGERDNIESKYKKHDPGWESDPGFMKFLMGYVGSTVMHC